MGAICMSEHVEKLRSLVDEALEDGAECAVSGIHSMGKNGEELVGQFFPPTVLINVNHSMRIMQEEVQFSFSVTQFPCNLVVLLMIKTSLIHVPVLRFGDIPQGRWVCVSTCHPTPKVSLQMGVSFGMQ
jgi:hypothetical protein